MTSIKTLLAAVLLIPVLSSAQQGTGLFTPGTSFEMQMMGAVPVCWVNEANEVNAYVKDEEGVKLITLQSKEKPDVGDLSGIHSLNYTNYGFMLYGNGINYFFGIDKPESKQVLDIMKNTVKGEIKAFNGYGVARHFWLAAKAPKLEELQAANSIYDVLGK